MELKEITQKMYEQAKQMGACEYYTGKEKTLEEVVALLKSAKGREFCVNNHFPALATMRLFKPFQPERLGVYIDAGVVTLHNPKHIVLSGHTAAVVTCDDDKLHRITVLQGASVTVNAAGWAVVHVASVREARVVKSVSGNAVIL